MPASYGKWWNLRWHRDIINSCYRTVPSYGKYSLFILVWRHSSFQLTYSLLSSLVINQLFILTHKLNSGNYCVYWFHYDHWCIQSKHRHLQVNGLIAFIFCNLYEKRGKYFPTLQEATCGSHFIVKCLYKFFL